MEANNDGDCERYPYPDGDETEDFQALNNALGVMQIITQQTLSLRAVDGQALHHVRASMIPADGQHAHAGTVGDRAQALEALDQGEASVTGVHTCSTFRPINRSA
ncbi:hypothetical protein D3879_15615 [Pseudomonas cavernicola]|uniref:Uncharacterized protein n=1 Tax=Pseudomonas cavernicola TaxID=2320866 RepID=A0A418XFB9_9PSED|nr:hypothetical protein D3879_15615 [Pseudomonas cavernicola]